MTIEFFDLQKRLAELDNLAIADASDLLDYCGFLAILPKEFLDVRLIDKLQSLPRETINVQGKFDQLIHLLNFTDFNQFEILLLLTLFQELHATQSCPYIRKTGVILDDVLQDLVPIMRGYQSEYIWARSKSIDGNSIVLDGKSYLKKYVDDAIKILDSSLY